MDDAARTRSRAVPPLPGLLVGNDGTVRQRLCVRTSLALVRLPQRAGADQRYARDAAARVFEIARNAGSEALTWRRTADERRSASPEDAPDRPAGLPPRTHRRVRARDGA